jgi:acylphosphatase
MSGDRVRVRLVISGRVQGVAFRAYTVDEAERLGVKGWVRNLADGRVEAVAEGTAAAVDGFVAWCRHGPPSARVSDVSVAREAYRGEFDSFDVHHGG